MRLGVVGGTFDPVHLGHVAMAEAAAACAELDLVLLLPSASPPHRGPARAPAADRLAMVKLAVAGRPRLQVSDLELSRPGPSFTVDTLSELRRRHPEAELYLVLGWDAARELKSWHQPERVLELARVVVVPRPGLPEPGRHELLLAGLDPERTQVCRAQTPAVDATSIREAIASGGALEGLLAPAVAGYITARGLYGQGGGA